MTTAKKGAKPEPTKAEAAPEGADTVTATPGTVTEEVTPQEQELLMNARALRERLENPHDDRETEPKQGQPQQVVQIEDERAQRELDLRVINEQLMYARQALAAGKVNRVLQQEGMIEPGQGKHDKQWRQEIIEARKGVDFLIELKKAVGPTGLPEPSPLEIATELPEGALSSV